MASSLCEIQLESKEDLAPCVSPKWQERLWIFMVLQDSSISSIFLVLLRELLTLVPAASLSLPHLVTHSYPPLPPVYFLSVCSPHTYPRTVIYPHISICFPQALQYKSFALGNWRHCCYFDKFPGGITQGLVCWGKFRYKLVVRVSLNF